MQGTAVAVVLRGLRSSLDSVPQCKRRDVMTQQQILPVIQTSSFTTSRYLATFDALRSALTPQRAHKHTHTHRTVYNRMAAQKINEAHEHMAKADKW